MLELSVHDCQLSNQNIYIKQYEKECFEELFPDLDSSNSVSVLFSIIMWYIVRKHWFNQMVKNEISK